MAGKRALRVSMTERSPMDGHKKQSVGAIVIGTLLAWLGLAGLSDSILEWQTWFEQGIMQHWRSIKEWMIAVVLDWVPFNVKSWMIDYSTISAVVARSHLKADIAAWKEQGMAHELENE